MKIFQLALLVTAANAFSVSNNAAATTTSSGRSRTTTSLNLFGGKKEGGENKAPGFMDQMQMFKKAQEMASKKQKLDEELQKETFEGLGAEGKVKATYKFVPVKNPMDPNPDYDPVNFEFDDDFFESASPEKLSAAVEDSIKDAIIKTNARVAEKYAVLQTDLMEALGAGKKASE